MVKSVKEIMNPNTSEDSYFLFDLKQNNAVQKKI